VKRAKKAIKKAVLTTKKVVQKTKAAVTKAKQQVKAAVQQTKQVVKEKVLPAVKKAAQATTKAVKNAVKPKNLLDTLQVGLDIVGMVPVVGEIADGVNGLIYLARGDKVNAALSFGAMIPIVGWAATGGKFVKKGAGVVKSVTEGVQNVLKGPVGRVVEKAKKQVANVKTQIQTKVAEVKQQLRQMLRPPQQWELAGAGGDIRRVEDTGTVGRNTTTPSPKPSNTQQSQNSSNKKPDEAAKGTGQATVVRSTEQSLNRVDQIRQEFNVGSKRNIAFAEYEINGKKGELIGVSGNADRVGTVGVPDKRIFDTITTGNNPRTLDSEVKILEDLSSSLSKDASGKVYLFSELPFCISCAGVIKQFKQRFPNIDVIIDHGPGGK
jgi:hypothetical protein